MTTTYVNALRLAEMATGESAGTWGTTTNTNLELIGESLGYGTENMASDANTTITMADGATDGVRSIYLKITSTTLTATREVTLAPNTISKLWIIENATTGGRSITIKQGSGATITIPNGSNKVVVTDGAGAGAVVYDALSDLDVDIVGGTIDGVAIVGGTINGAAIGGTTAGAGSFTTIGASAAAVLSSTLGVTDVATFTAAPVFLSATASLPMFTNGSKALTTNAMTGTGNVVMSASPTMTGTIGAAAMTLSSTLNGNTFTTGTYTLTGAAGKTLTFSNSLTLAGTDATTMTFPATTGTVGVLSNESNWTKQQYFGTSTLTDGATISWNAADAQVCKVTLAGNRTMAAPSNLADGAFYAIYIIQDGTGSRTISWNSVFKFTGAAAPTLTTTAAAKDFINFRSDATNLYEIGRSLNVG